MGLLMIDPLRGFRAGRNVSFQFESTIADLAKILHLNNVKIRSVRS